jgi:NADH-quinone oxidoreductase subunit E
MEVQLGLLAGQTSADLEHTLETVNCLGACAFGPVLIADGEYIRQMTVSKVDRLLKGMR